MAKKPPNQGKQWTSKDVGELITLAKQNTPTRLIAFKMGRTLTFPTAHFDSDADLPPNV
jgi:hypothetical protein